jgi:hypothetical protein
MKTKTIILVSWPVSVLLVGWLGGVVGLKIGFETGTASYHNDRVRRLQVDVFDVAEHTDPHTRDALRATAKLAGEMIDRGGYADASREFAVTIKELQNKPRVTTGDDVTR